jgi:phosphoserine phosphatase
MTLYLVRHGETDYNLRRAVQGRRINAPLNATGRAQAARLGERFAGVPLTALYASPLLRARQTAEAIGAHHPALPLHLDADLEEMSWGVLAGAPESDETRAVFDELYRRWDAGDYDAGVEAGETIREVQDRALRAWDRLLRAHACGTVAVVSHGRLIRVLMASVLPEFGLARMHSLFHANTSVNHLVVEGGVCRAERLNCTVHLRTGEAVGEAA